MLQLTTSRRISIKFTLYTMVIVFFFGILVNLAFFQQRYKSENERLIGRGMQQQMMGNRPRFQIPNVEEMEYDDEVETELRNNTIISNITEIDEQYILFAQVGNKIKVSNVTRMVEAQEKLAWVFVILLIIFSAGTYGLSLIFVRSSLRNINELVDYVKALDIHTLHEPVPLQGPENDEIRIIGDTLQKTLTTIKEQTDSLRDFVTHASHELKTPLMSLSAVLDTAQKTGDYEQTFTSAKRILSTINNLFETLLLITKWEYHHIQTSSIDIVPIIQDIMEEVEDRYASKHISCKMNLPKTYLVHSNKEIVRIILINLIQNAYKYTPNKGDIALQLKADALQISNTGPGISPEASARIWDKFWKEHNNKESKDGFGLGLYLVKLLVQKHQWEVGMKSTPHKLTTFIINFKD